MSDIPGAIPNQPGQQPTEEQLRAALMEMRNSPVDAMVAQVLQMLLEGVQIKLGRRDARLLLDTTQAMIDRMRTHLDAGLVRQVDDALNQLRMAQVDAEKQVAADPEPEPNDLAVGATRAGQPDGDAAPTQAPDPSAQSASRLWTPGS